MARREKADIEAIIRWEVGRSWSGFSASVYVNTRPGFFARKELLGGGGNRRWRKRREGEKRYKKNIPQTQTR